MQNLGEKEQKDKGVEHLLLLIWIQAEDPLGGRVAYSIAL
jgi:hypothetical protein